LLVCQAVFPERLAFRAGILTDFAIAGVAQSVMCKWESMERLYGEALVINRILQKFFVEFLMTLRWPYLFVYAVINDFFDSSDCSV
jgi:hypothetical protein